MVQCSYPLSWKIFNGVDYYPKKIWSDIIEYFLKEFKSLSCDSVE